MVRNEIFEGTPAGFHKEVAARAEALAHDPTYWAMLAMKEVLRRRDERRKPLAEYRDEELARMSKNFYGPAPSYHEARRRFVHKLVPNNKVRTEEAWKMRGKRPIWDASLGVPRSASPGAEATT